MFQGGYVFYDILYMNCKNQHLSFPASGCWAGQPTPPVQGTPPPEIAGLPSAIGFPLYRPYLKSLGFWGGGGVPCPG